MTGVVLSVSQLNRYVKSIIEEDMNLQTVFVQGEISNFTNHYRTGHYYMTVKDEYSSIKAVMFKSANQRLRFMPENSMSVIIKGRVSVFERDGQYQLYIDDMQPDGAGALSVAFEQLKAKLAAKGLFDESRKKPVPKYPERIGVVTSPTGAAIKDIVNVISRRFPAARLILCPVQVQGANAAPQIKEAIELFNRKKAADVLIVGRGGGSTEELWAFNEEAVAIAVAESEIPVISAVGHETDYTICDFAADLRAPTPSAAAELAVPDTAELLRHIENFSRRNASAVNGFVAAQSQRVDARAKLIKRLSPKNYINDLSMRCDGAWTRIDTAVRHTVQLDKNKTAALCARLDALSPLKIIARGFAAASFNGKVLTDPKEVKSGDIIDLRLAGGELKCKVTE